MINNADEVADYIEWLAKRNENIISDDYIGRIAEAISADVLENLKETADEDWSDGDMKLAVGRVLCDRLGLES